MNSAADRSTSTAALPLVASLLRRWSAPTPVEAAAEDWGVEVPYLSFVPSEAPADSPWPLAA